MSGPRRWSIVYGFRILDPATMRVLVDYVGKTVQKLAARERQHRGQDFETDDTEQPWSDLIVGKPFIIEQGLWTAAELAERERFHIHRLKPRYNYEHNLDNPARIPIPVARRQREARDAAKGVASPDWAAKGTGQRQAVPGKVARRAAAARAAVAAPRWTPAVKRAAGSHAVRVAAAWLVLAGLLWWLANRAALSAVAGPQYAAAAATGLLLGLWAFVERRSRKGTVRFWRACSLLAVAVLAGFVVWPWVGPHWAEFRHWTELQQAVSR